MTPLPPKSIDGRSRRRFERAQVQHRRLRGVYLRSAEFGAAEIRVINISELGVGIDTTGVAKLPEIGREFAAHLLVGKTAIPINVSIVHITPTLTGMEFRNITDLVRGAIRSFFEPELVGAAMRPVGAPPKAAIGEDRILDFADKSANTLSLTLNNGRLRRFTIGILGASVEWSEGGRICLIQNLTKEPVSDFLRSQLIKFTQSLEVIDGEHQKALETIIAST